MTAILVILAGAVVAMAMQNRRLSSQIAALLDRQEQAEQKLDRLSKTSRKQTSRQRKYEHKLEVQRKKQARLAKQQEQIRKEQTRQADTLNKMQFKLNQALADIETGNTRLSQLFALLDIAEANQAAAAPGSSQDVRFQKQIVTLTAQIARTEKQIAKAQFDRDTATAAIAA